MSIWEMKDLENEILTAGAWRGHLRIIRTALDHGAAVDDVTKRLYSYVLPANTFSQGNFKLVTQSGHLDVAHLLLENGTERPTGPKSGTAVYEASKFGFACVLKALLKVLLEIHSALLWENHLCPMLAAAGHGQQEVVQVLLDNGFHLQFPQMSMMRKMYAVAQKGHDSILHLLVRYGVKAVESIEDLAF